MRRVSPGVPSAGARPGPPPRALRDRPAGPEGRGVVIDRPDGGPRVAPARRAFPRGRGDRDRRQSAPRGGTGPLERGGPGDPPRVPRPLPCPPAGGPHATGGPSGPVPPPRD